MASARKEGVELTESEIFVDAFAQMLNIVSLDKAAPQGYNEADLLEKFRALKDSNPHIEPIVKLFEETEVKDHHKKDTKSYHGSRLAEISEMYAKEKGMDIHATAPLLEHHELFEAIRERMDPPKSHRGKSAFGEKGHLR